MITSTLLRAYAWMQARHPDLLWRGNPSRREVALTFDDGPHPRDTPAVLDVLARNEIRATFFLIGENIERNRGLVRKIHEGGHQIAIHCYRHTAFPLEDPRRLRDQLGQTRNRLAGICEIPPENIRYIRPPYGLFTAKTKSMLADWDYQLVMWNCIPPHFMQPLGWTIRQVLDSSIPGSIIVLHDGHGHGTKAAQIVETIVPQLKARKFNFVTIAQMQNRKNS